MLHDFSYRAPEAREELFDLLTDCGQAGAILAGGTDILTNIRLGITAPSLLIDIKKIPAYCEIAFDRRDGLTLGAAVTINRLKEHPAVTRNFPLLVRCAEQLASHQIRNRATVAGNVVNASPCADMAPALLCLDARAEIGSAGGKREVPFREFFTGVKSTVLETGEVLERIRVPADFAGARAGYLKLKRIRGHDLGIIGVAMLKGRETIRIAVGSAAPTPVLVGEFAAGTPLESLKGAVLEAIHPIDDVRCTKEYREFMAGVFVERLYREV